MFMQEQEKRKLDSSPHSSRPEELHLEKLSVNNPTNCNIWARHMKAFEVFFFVFRFSESFWGFPHNRKLERSFGGRYFGVQFEIEN